MAKAADTEDGNQVARPRAAVAKRVEGREPGTHERAGFVGRESVGQARERSRWGNHVIGVAAVERDASNADPSFAGEEVRAAALVAVAAVPRVPTDTNLLAGGP